MILKPHSVKQQDLLFFDKNPEKRVGVGATGIQWGKTLIGAAYMKLKMCRYTDKSDNFLITSPSFPVLAQSTLPPFLELMEGLGTHDKKENCFRMHNGGTCWFRTATNPDSVVGITNVRAVLCDEAGLYPLYFWENIQGRAAFREAPILIVTSPYSLNWLWRDIIRPKTKDPTSRPDVFMVQARSDENPYFPKTEYENRRKTMDPRRFRMMFGGSFERPEGLVYDCFADSENICERCTMPDGTRFVAGVDWGTTNPFVLIVRAITPQGFHYQTAEFYKTGLTPVDMVETALKMKAVWGIERFYADPSEPGLIEMFNQNRLPTSGANNDITKGIGFHYELIKTRRYRIFEGTSPHTIDEYETYHYPEPQDLKPDQNPREINPIKQNDHSCDANRYVSIETYKGILPQKRKVHNETDKPLDKLSAEDQFKRLTKRRNFTRTETWS